MTSAAIIAAAAAMVAATSVATAAVASLCGEKQQQARLCSGQYRARLSTLSLRSDRAAALASVFVQTQAKVGAQVNVIGRKLCARELRRR
mmetsp:Transcript_6828/g.18275  ORF Transcript_6828/g.18275 Transcript_6828/m.18275 type:complete len:90 (-) Transcript_6828:265-534(-)